MATGSASPIIGEPGLSGIDRSRVSPNYGERADGFPNPEIVLLHYTGMRDGASAIAWLCDPASQVSCHYVVAEDGTVLQLVDERHRAWHAGRSSWAGITDINSASIGIEIINGGHDFGLPSYPDIQVETVARLCRDIVRRHRIRPERVLAHSDVAPGRKRDPGERFPWRQLAEAGVGLWAATAGRTDGAALGPGDSGPEVRAWQLALGRYGYGIAATAEYDEATQTVVRAFQRHFRPALIDGRADTETRDILEQLGAACGRPPMA